VWHREEPVVKNTDKDKKTLSSQVSLPEIKKGMIATESMMRGSGVLTGTMASSD